MSGEGLVAMDVALLMACLLAAGVNAYYWPSCFRVGYGVGLMRVLRFVGWSVLVSRYGAVLFATGDILISVPAAIGLFFLAAGEAIALFNHGKQVPL